MNEILGQIDKTYMYPKQLDCAHPYLQKYLDYILHFSIWKFTRVPFSGQSEEQDGAQPLQPERGIQLSHVFFTVLTDGESNLVPQLLILGQIVPWQDISDMRKIFLKKIF